MNKTTTILFLNIGPSEKNAILDTSVFSLVVLQPPVQFDANMGFKDPKSGNVAFDCSS